MRKIFFLLLITFCLPANQFAQDLMTDYKLLQAEGPMPQESKGTIRSKIKSQSREVRKNEKKIHRQVMLHTLADIDELFKSGSVLFNDTISRYVNSITKRVLAHSPELQGKIRVFVLRSTDVNALCFANGIIFINMGLLAKLHNDDELAFVLAHEISHFQKSHSLQRVQEYERIQKQNANKRTYEEKILEMYSYSRENETEADTAGLKLYLEAGFPASGAVTALQILQDHAAPIGEISPELVFGPHSLPFIKETELRNYYSYTADDRYSTHPDIAKRLALMQKLCTASSSPASVASSDLLYIRDLAGFECSNYFLTERNYISAFNWSTALLQKFPKNKYLLKIQSKSIYALGLFKKGTLKYGPGSLHDDAIPDPSRINNSSAVVNHFFLNVSAEQLDIFLLQHLWMRHTIQPADSWYKNALDSVTNLVLSGSEARQALSTATDTVLPPVTGSLAILQELLADSSFVNHLKSFDLKTSTFANRIKRFEPAAKVRKKRRQRPQPVLKEGEGIVVLLPDYNYSSEKPDKGKNVLIAEKNRDLLFERLQGGLEQNGIPATFVKIDSIDSYNQLSDLNAYMNERIDAGTDNLNPVFGTDSLDLLKKDPSRHFCLQVSVTNREIKESVGMKLVILYAWGWLVFPIPLVIYQIANPPKDLNIVINLIDLNNGRVVRSASASGSYREHAKKINREVDRFLSTLK